jgi:lipopolysaccharide transport system permease protein
MAASALLNPIRFASGFWQKRYLISQLVKREVLLKYRGSFMGIGWSFLHPMLLLATYTLVFGKTFGGHWAQSSSNETPYVLFVFCGLVVFGLFSEVASIAPRYIFGYSSYVKKIIFPSEILPLVLFLSACIHACISLLILSLSVLLFGHLYWSALLIPIVLFPFLLFILGISWFLSAIGVFVRDMVHLVPTLVQITLFISPVFYPVNIMPDYLHWIFLINPISNTIENIRLVLLLGSHPEWTWLAASYVIGFFTLLIGYRFFSNSKEEFADVI